MGSSLLSLMVLAIVAVSVTLYLFPVLIGRARRVPDIGAIAVIDILLGWTVIGWVIALAMAMRSPAPRGPAAGPDRQT
jgi:Superinfection immunity protein